MRRTEALLAMATTSFARPAAIEGEPRRWRASSPAIASGRTYRVLRSASAHGFLPRATSRAGPPPRSTARATGGGPAAFLAPPFIRRRGQEQGGRFPDPGAD